MPQMLSKHTVETPKADTRKDSRNAERITFKCRVTYTGEIPAHPYSGEGFTKDISICGLRIASSLPMIRGTLLTLIIALPDGHPPLTIFSTLVTRVSHSHFSVRFMDLSKEARRRLQSFICKHINQESVSTKWTRFRIT